jgi:hypothetical protein
MMSDPYSATPARNLAGVLQTYRVVILVTAAAAAGALVMSGSA